MTMKKLLPLFFLTLLPLLASADDSMPMAMVIIDGINYHLLPSVNEAEVTNSNSYTGNIEIPEEVVYNGTEYRVTCIEKSAFSGCKYLTSVTIPNSVTKIKETTFANCSGLTSVNIPNSVTSIGKHAFYNCKGLTSVSIPNSVTEIQNSAFRDCSGLTSVIIPNRVAEIGEEAFAGCSGLKSIVVETGNTVYDSREECNAIIKTSDNELIAGCMNTTIPGSVTTISQSAFFRCIKLTSITIPNGMTKIGSYAFQECSGLTSVTIPGSVTEIGDDAFHGCENLRSLTIHDGVIAIGNEAFAGCRSLTSVIIPNSVITIGEGAFNACERLTSIAISNNVTSIGSYSFAGCKRLTSVVIPNGVTKIGYRAFDHCSKLTSIIIPNSVTEISIDAFRGCSGLTSVVIPNSITSINDNTFYGCSSLTSIVIPNSVTKISGYAFQNCTNLLSITIPNGVMEIGDYAFSGCSSVSSIYIGNTVKSLGYGTFGECKKLLDVYCYSESVPEAKSNALYTTTFYNTNIENVTLHVPAASVSAYQATEPWSKFKEIVALPTREDSRPFVKEGKTWNVIRSNSDGGHHFDYYMLMNEKVEKAGKSYIKMYRSEDDMTVVYDEGLLREENHKVYLFDSDIQKEFLLFDYSLKVGDTYETYSYGEQKMVSYKVLSVDYYTEGPEVIRYDYIEEADSTETQYRYLRKWTVCRTDDNSRQKTWIEGIGSLEGPLANLYDEPPVSFRNNLAYVEYDNGDYLPFSFHDEFGHVYGCNLPTGKADHSDWHHQLTYELEGDRLHVYGKALTNCGPNNYAYFYERSTDDPLVHKIEFVIQDVDPVATCMALHATNFYVPGFDPNMNYIVVDNQGGEHPVINKTPQLTYRPFVEDGKVWKVGIVSGNPVQVVDYYYFDGDTIINGKACKQMMCQRFVSPDFSDEGMAEPFLNKVGAWYEENRRVYFYDEQKQTMVMKYDFSVGDNESLQLVDDYPPFVIGPRQTGGMEGFKGVYRDVMANQDIRNTTWLEGVGSVEGPLHNVYIGNEYYKLFLMSCTVGDEVIYLNDEYEDGATPAEARKKRFDFTHTIKIQPKAPMKREKASGRSAEEHSLYGEYNDLQLDIHLNPLDEAYLVRIANESGQVVYEKTVNAGNIVALNIDISAYAKGRYIVTVENNHESFAGGFEAQTTGIEENVIIEKLKNVSIYNLHGQRISSLRKGLNIVNGQKIYVK